MNVLLVWTIATCLKKEPHHLSTNQQRLAINSSSSLFPPQTAHSYTFHTAQRGIVSASLQKGRAEGDSRGQLHYPVAGDLLPGQGDGVRIIKVCKAGIRDLCLASRTGCAFSTASATALARSLAMTAGGRNPMGINFCDSATAGVVGAEEVPMRIQPCAKFITSRFTVATKLATVKSQLS